MKLAIVTVIMGMLYLLILGLTGQEVWLNTLISTALDFIQAPILITVMNVVKWLASFECLLIVMLLATFYLYRKKKEQSLTYFLCFVIAGGLAMIFLKEYYVVGHPELSKFLPIAGLGYLNIDVLFGTFLYGMIYVLMDQENSLERVIKKVCLVLIIAVGIANFYLKVSYFSDILLGYLLGLFLCWIFATVIKRNVTKLSLENDSTKDKTVI